MNLSLSNSELVSLRALIKTKDENIFASEVILDYLRNHNRDLNKTFLRKNKEKALYIDEKAVRDVFARFIAGMAGFRSPSEMKRHGFGYRLNEVDAPSFLSNPYYQNVKFKNVKHGRWELKYLSYQPFEVFAFNDLLVDETSFQETTRLGYFIDEFPFPVVSDDEGVWMSVTPHEVETMRKASEDVNGNVLVLGLGLGYFPYLIAQKKEVNKITIIETDEEAISLFNKYLLPQFPNKEKIQIIHADAFNYVQENLSNGNFTYCFVDLWRSVDDGLPLFINMKKYEKLASDTKFIYWIEQSLLAMIRRYVITLFQESLEGLSAKDYQKAKTEEDKIFNQLYAKIGGLTFDSFDKIKRFLSDESLNNLLKQ